MAVAFAIGTALPVINVIGTTAIQEKTPRKIIGRVAGIGATLTGAAASLGYLFGGIAVDALDKNVPLMFEICGVALIVDIVLFSFSTRFREFLGSKLPT